jgi:hypothetical protein
MPPEFETQLQHFGYSFADFIEQVLENESQNDSED